MIFLTSVEVKPLPGSKMRKHGVGGMVYCFIPAKTKVEAKKRLRAALEEDRYSLIRIEFLEDYEKFTWEKPKEQKEYDTLAKKSAVEDEVIYGQFYTWKRDD
jgi:hypothetical protein